MTDKELLELAAKAAGIELGEYWTPYLEEIHNQHWNPLRNDGQALRLAVKLELDVMCASVRSVEDNVNITIEAGTDLYAATRRAIVRAAADIGKTL